MYTTGLSSYWEPLGDDVEHAYVSLSALRSRYQVEIRKVINALGEIPVNT